MKTFKQYLRTPKANSGNLQLTIGVPNTPTKEPDQTLIVVGDQICLDNTDVRECILGFSELAIHIVPNIKLSSDNTYGVGSNG
jgi:hypothetical protein